MIQLIRRISIVIMMIIAFESTNAQVANPCWPYTGIGTMYFCNGIYYGQIYMGYAHGEGYYYFYDGSAFHGYFNAGFANGPGEVICALGYISGIWQGGVCVQTNQVSQQQINQAYNNIQYYYNNNSTIQNRYRQNNATNSDFALSNYKIEDVSNTSFGKQLMGKME